MEVISVCCSRESMVLHYFYTVQRVNSEQNQDTFVRTPAGMQRPLADPRSLV